MAIGNPNFGRFERNDEEISENEREEVADPSADTEDDILERINREKEEKKKEDKERRETPPAIVNEDDIENPPLDVTQEEDEEGKDFSEFENDSLPSREGSRKGAEVKDTNVRLYRKSEPRFYRTKKMKEDKRFKKKAA